MVADRYKKVEIAKKFGIGCTSIYRDLSDYEWCDSFIFKMVIK